jgi:hypothetical protein
MTTWGLSIMLVRLVANIVDGINNTRNYCINNRQHVRSRQIHANVFVVLGSCHDSVEADHVCDPEAQITLSSVHLFVFGSLPSPSPCIQLRVMKFAP